MSNNVPGRIYIAPYAFKRGEEDYWPAVAIYTYDQNGKEQQLFYAEPGYGNGHRGAGFKTEQEALEEAQHFSAPYFDNGRLHVAYKGQVYQANHL